MIENLAFVVCTSRGLSQDLPLPHVFFETVPVSTRLCGKNVSHELAITKNLPDLNPKSTRD